MLRTLSAPQTPRPESEKMIKLKIMQLNVGHEADSSTAVYTHVSDDFMNAALRRALAPALDDGHVSGSGRKDRR